MTKFRFPRFSAGGLSAFIFSLSILPLPIVARIFASFSERFGLPLLPLACAQIRAIVQADPQATKLFVRLSSFLSLDHCSSFVSFLAFCSAVDISGGGLLGEGGGLGSFCDALLDPFEGVRAFLFPFLRSLIPFRLCFLLSGARDCLGDHQRGIA